MTDEGTGVRTVGVVIRTLNESELIGRCLETLGAQRGEFDLDVLVVDSGSTDATVEIAQRARRQDRDALAGRLRLLEAR